jgi:hypothetical protein
VDAPPGGAGARLPALVAHLRPKRLLLVVDGIEDHLAAAESFAALAQQVPGLKLIAVAAKKRKGYQPLLKEFIAERR